MDQLYTTYALYGLGAVALGAALAKVRRRLQLSKAKHRSLAGHSRMSRRRTDSRNLITRGGSIPPRVTLTG